MVKESEVDVDSLQELSDKIRDLTDESMNYSLTVYVPLSQPYFIALAESSLGRALERLKLNPEYEDGNPPVIDTSEVSFPRLKSFNSMCQAIKAVDFSSMNFPMLETISIEQPCARSLEYFSTDLPNLRSLGFEFVDLDDVSDFGPSVSRSPKLERICCYKLWGLGGKAVHRLILPSCTSINFYRSDDLRSLKLWAPKLETLNLQACYSIQNVSLLSRKPAGFSGPEYSVRGVASTFTVNCVNTSVPGGNRVTSDRCKKVEQNAEELGFGFGW